VIPNVGGKAVEFDTTSGSLVIWRRNVPGCRIHGVSSIENENVDGVRRRIEVQDPDGAQIWLTGRSLAECTTARKDTEGTPTRYFESVPASHPNHITDRYVLKIHRFSVGISGKHP
jgi:hypothetical protein